MIVDAPTDPLSAPQPPPVVARFRSADEPVELALPSGVFLDGAWRSCLDRTFAAGAGFRVPHLHAHTDEVHFIRDGVVTYGRAGAYGAYRHSSTVTGRWIAESRMTGEEAPLRVLNRYTASSTDRAPWQDRRQRSSSWQ